MSNRCQGGLPQWQNRQRQQPEGFNIPGKEHMVCKLNKGVYGLKQSGRLWNNLLKSELEQIGFTSSEADHTVFF